jgi:hypothetical protein
MLECRELLARAEVHRALLIGDRRGQLLLRGARIAAALKQILYPSWRFRRHTFAMTSWESSRLLPGPSYRRDSPGHLISALSTIFSECLLINSRMRWTQLDAEICRKHEWTDDLEFVREPGGVDYGAGTGIGEGVARAMAAQGAAVVLSGRREGKLEQVRDAIRADGGNRVFCPPRHRGLQSGRHGGLTDSGGVRPDRCPRSQRGNEHSQSELGGGKL